MRPSNGKPGLARSLVCAAACLAALLVPSAGAALTRDRPPGVGPTSTDPRQPPEQPPQQPPEEPPGEEEEPQAPETPAGEAPAGDPATDEATAGETPGEAGQGELGEAGQGEPGEAGEGEPGEAGEGEPGETEGGEPEDEEEGPARRAPEVVTAPVGILPGRLVSTPAPVPGGSIIGMVLGPDGFLLHTAGGDVVAYEPDGARTRWGVPGAGAAFVAEDSGTVILLGEDGDVVLRQLADGTRTGGFSTGFAPDRGGPPGRRVVRRPPCWRPECSTGSPPERSGDTGCRRGRWCSRRRFRKGRRRASWRSPLPRTPAAMFRRSSWFRWAAAAWPR